MDPFDQVVTDLHSVGLLEQVVTSLNYVSPLNQVS